jgi:hypothetical protein
LRGSSGGLAVFIVRDVAPDTDACVDDGHTGSLAGLSMGSRAIYIHCTAGGWQARRMHLTKPPSGLPAATIGAPIVIQQVNPVGSRGRIRHG